MTKVERRAYEDVFYQAGARRVLLVEKTMEQAEAEIPAKYGVIVGIYPVSYTHLDVYKRQEMLRTLHASGVRVDHEFDIRERIDFYEALCKSHGGDVYKRQV